MQYKKFSFFLDILARVAYTLFLYTAFSFKLVASNEGIDVKAMLMNQPVLFEENKGQLKDMNGNAVPEVLFKTSLPGLSTYITRSGITYVFNSFKKEDKEDEHAEEVEGPKEVDWCREDMELVGAVIKPENIRKLFPSQAYMNFFHGHCPQGVMDVRGYEKVIIKNVYPQIDWILYGTSKDGFKYDFHVHPGADPSLIKIKYKGAGKVNVRDKEISIKTRMGKLLEGNLYCYQNNSNRNVSSRYVEKNGVIQIELDDYDTNDILVIDPPIHVRSWATIYSGGMIPIQGGISGGITGPEYITVDDNGNVYATGYTSHSDFPVVDPGGGAYYDGTLNFTNNISYQDAFIVKFDNNGTLLWSTYYGGKLADWGSSIATDNAGNVFVAGHTASVNFPIQNPGGGVYYQNAYAGGGGTVFTDGDLFILKFNSAGVRQWATYYGGSHNDGNFGLAGPAITTDVFGNVFVTGGTSSPDFPVQNLPGAYNQASYAGGPTAYGMDMFILKFNNAGVRQWATYLGGTGEDLALAINCDKAGNLLISGWSLSTAFPLQNPGSGAYFQSVNAGAPAAVGVGYQTGGGGGDAVIMKFGNNGNMLWSTYYGGSDFDIASGIVSDSKGNIFVTGCTGTNKQWGNTSPGATRFPVFNPGGCTYFQGGSGGATDFFILKFSDAGLRLWATYYGGRDDDGAIGLTRGPDIKCDVYDNIVIVGASGNGAVTPIIGDLPLFNPGGAFFQGTLRGYEDAAILKFDNEGERLWATYYGGATRNSGLDWAESVAIDNNGNIFITGEAWSTDFPLQNGGSTSHYQSHTAAKDNGFFLKFSKTCQLAAAVNHVNANCGSLGSATVVANPAPTTCSPYYYLWSNGETTSSISNLTAGTYSVTVTDSLGCSADASVTILSASSGSVSSSQNASICSGDSFLLPGGTVVSTAGLYIDTLLTSTGCDSIITTNLAVHNSITTSSNQSVCQGQSVLIHGQMQSAAGLYTQTFVAASGCDSISSITLNVSSISSNTVTINSCSPYTYNGQTYSSSGVYTQTLINASGCDSIVVLDVSIGASVNTSATYATCHGNPVSIHGVNQLLAGVYTQTFVAANGCDSISVVTLNVNAPSSNTLTVSSCNNYTHNGQLYSLSGVYTQTLVGASGCDSLLTLDISLNGTVSTTGNRVICSGQSSNIHGVNQTTPGVYTQTFTAVNGCDSISSVTLAVSLPSTNTIAVNGCSSYVHNGQTYSSTGVYSQTLSGANGCDSVLTLDVTINTPVSTVADTSVCEGEFLMIHGQVQTLPGVYTQTFVAANGCDSVSTVILNIYPGVVASFQAAPDPAQSGFPVYFTDRSQGAILWQWNFGDVLNSSAGTQSPSFIYTDTGSFTVQLTVVNQYGCVDTITQTVYVEQEFVFYAPNAFTPNGDGLNDTFLPKGFLIDADHYELYIFDRWGSEIYRSVDPLIGWNGIANGGDHIAQIDTYVWVVKLKDLKGVSHRYVGHVNLIR